MCELLGMSANVPTDICFSFTGLVQRGGGTGPHKDGWGITFYEGKAVAHSRIPSRAFSRRSRNWFRITPLSPVPSSPIFVRPTAGGWPREHPSLHPRTVGRNWTYAHNGQLKGYKSLKTGNFHPVGETDSEKRFAGCCTV